MTMLSLSRMYYDQPSYTVGRQEADQFKTVEVDIQSRCIWKDILRNFDRRMQKGHE